MYDAKQKNQKHEREGADRLLKAQQEAEERRFQSMQAQQDANPQIFMQVMGTVLTAMCPGQQHRRLQHLIHPAPLHLTNY